MVAIPPAGLVGIGLVMIYDTSLKPESKGWLLAVSVMITGICQ